MIKPLTKVQLDHFRLRLDQAKNDAMRRKLNALGERPDQPELSWEQKAELIRNGTAKLSPTATKYADVQHAFDFPLTAEQVRIQEAAKAYDAQVDAIKDALTAEYNLLLDQAVMSPDGMGALAKLNDAFK